MPKNKSHKGLLKRIRVTNSGMVKVRRAGGRHLKSHKSRAVIRGYRKPNYVRAAEADRIGSMLNIHVRSAEAAARDKAAAEARDESAESSS